MMNIIKGYNLISLEGTQYLNFRNSPWGRIIGRIRHASEVEILDTQVKVSLNLEWVHVRQDNTTGWIALVDALTLMPRYYDVRQFLLPDDGYVHIDNESKRYQTYRIDEGYYITIFGESWHLYYLEQDTINLVAYGTKTDTTVMGDTKFGVPYLPNHMRLGDTFESAAGELTLEDVLESKVLVVIKHGLKDVPRYIYDGVFIWGDEIALMNTQIQEHLPYPNWVDEYLKSDSITITVDMNNKTYKGVLYVQE